MTHVLRFLVLVGLVVALTPGQGAAQARRTKPPVAIDKVDMTENLRTPEYRTASSSGAKRPRDWTRFMVRYTSVPEWVDGLTVRYHVLLRDAKAEDGKVYTLCRLDVSYSDISRKRKPHISVAYLREEATERFGKVYAYAVELVHGGGVVDAEAEGGKKLPKKWWTDDRVIQSDKVVVRTGYLLNRNKSPWSLVNVDDYEQIN